MPAIRRNFAVPVALATLVASTAPALELWDVHLDVLPRSHDEAARLSTPTHDLPAPQADEHLSGGTATVVARTDPDAFSQPSANLTFEQELVFHAGNKLFRQVWTAAPGPDADTDGLGPLFNARSCQQCHIRDGRSQPPGTPDDKAGSMVTLISVPADPDPQAPSIPGHIPTRPDPTYGTQLQDKALPGHNAEVRLVISHTRHPVALSGGETIVLQRPDYRVTGLGYGPLHPVAMLSPRVAPQMIGLGLLEAIPAADILSGADPGDLDGDGISGRANIVWSSEFDRPMLGRFGHKAAMPTLRAQTAQALVVDLGLSSPMRPFPSGDCTRAQSKCLSAKSGAADASGSEISAEALDSLVFYSRNLGVPARRDVDDPQVLRGKAVFNSAGCAACHRPSFLTHKLADRPEHSLQLIHPYTDLLLHDMGDNLADNRPEAGATGREWRTPPLWGIGLTRQVSGHTRYLHDGRARSLLEAILWHGGEAQAARDTVIALPRSDRDALIRFLESL